jgi:hypothetical protein
MSSIPSPDEALAGMAKVGNPRVPMGNDGYTFNNASGAPSKYTHPMPRGGGQAADPTVMPGQPGTHRYAAYDRNGAHYGVVVNYAAQTSPEAGATQANGRIVRSVAGKSAPNFYDGASASTY